MLGLRAIVREFVRVLNCCTPIAREEQVFVEVETGRSDVIVNATKCATLTGRVVFVFTDTRVREANGLRRAFP